MKTSWNPLTWGAESGGYWLVFLVVAVVVICFLFAAHERKLEKGRDLLARDEAEFGPVSPDLRDEIRRTWPVERSQRRGRG